MGVIKEKKCQKLNRMKLKTFAKIKVVGIGGAGGSAVNRMKDVGLKQH